MTNEKTTTIIHLYQQKGAAAILLAVLILAVLLAISLGISATLSSQITMMRQTVYSVEAFYAADAGAEQCLYQVRKPPQTDTCDTSPSTYINSTLTNGASYKVSREANTTIKSLGSYRGTNRKIELNW